MENCREGATFNLALIQPAYQLSVELFQRQFIFRYFKNSFEGNFHSMAAALAVSLFPLRQSHPPLMWHPMCRRARFLASAQF